MPRRVLLRDSEAGAQFHQGRRARRYRGGRWTPAAAVAALTRRASSRPGSGEGGAERASTGPAGAGPSDRSGGTVSTGGVAEEAASFRPFGQWEPSRASRALNAVLERARRRELGTELSAELGAGRTA